MSRTQPLPYWRLSGFYFFYFCVVGAISPFWASYLVELGYSPKEIGIMTAVIMGTRLLAPNFWSWLADKRQQRLGIVRLGSGLACILFLGVFIDQRFWWLIAVVSGYTFFWHAVLPQFEVITLGYLDKNYQRYGQIRLWGSLGFVFAVVFLGWLFDHASIRYLPIAILTFLVLILLSSFGLREQKKPVIPRAKGLFRKQAFHPSILIFLLASLLLQISHGPYYTFYTLYLVENLGYSRTIAGLMWALGVMAEVLMFIYMPVLMRRFQLRTLFLSVLIITTMRWVIIATLAQNSILLCFAQLLHACSFAAAHAVSIEVIRRHFINGSQSQGQALYSSISFGAGGAIGAFMSGSLWTFNPELTFLLAACATFTAFLLMAFGRRSFQVDTKFSNG